MKNLKDNEMFPMVPLSELITPPEKMAEMCEIMRRVDELAGIDTSQPVVATAEELKARMIARGWNVNANHFQRELMKMRYGEDWDKS